MWEAFAVQKLFSFFQQKISVYYKVIKHLRADLLKSSLSWRSFEQLGPDGSIISDKNAIYVKELLSKLQIILRKKICQQAELVSNKIA